MAKRKNLPKDLKFENIYFNDREKIEYSSWIGANPMTVSEVLYSLTDGNCKVSVSQNVENGHYIATLTPKKKGTPVSDSVFMFRHTNLEKALWVALYWWSEVTDCGETYEGDTDEYDW